MKLQGKRYFLKYLDQAWNLIRKGQVSIQEMYNTFARYKFIVGKDCGIEIL